MLEGFRKRLARVLMRGLQVRSYYGAGGGRLTATWRAPTTSADTELHTALATLRARSRELIRNGSYARRAKVIVVNNVVGAGIGMQAQVRPSFRERLDDRANSAIEQAWEEWARAANCHVSGRLHFADLERIVMGEIFEAGEVLVRKHYARFGRSKIPLALEVIEAERLADDYTLPPGVDPLRYRMGIEHDAFMRPVAYWLRERHPGDVRPNLGSTGGGLIRIPASEIQHLYVAERSPQSRGIPWLHTAMRRLNDMDGYTEAEIVAARGAANYMAVIKTEAEGNPLGTEDATGTQMVDLEPGTVQKLAAGEEMEFNNPSRPNPNMEGFLRYLLREVASGIGVSYESLSRDYSQSNYSSSRLALIDDRDLWRTLQQWFIRSFRDPLHREWLSAAVLARAVPGISTEEFMTRPEKFEAVKFKPRGWSWVDPTKEVDAYIAAIKAGLTTRTDVIASTANGQDIEDIDATREQELKAAGERGLEFETDPEAYMPPEPAPPAPPPAAAAEPEEPDDDESEDPESQSRMPRQSRQVSLLQMATFIGERLSSVIDTRDGATAGAVRELAAAMRGVELAPTVNIAPAVINVEAPTVNLEATIDVPPTVVNVAAAQIDVRVPEQPAPVVNIAPAEVTVNVPEGPAPIVNVAPEVRVDVPQQTAPQVHVTVPDAPREQLIERDGTGNIVAIRSRRIKER